MSIGEVAKRSGLPISTLHFYENKGLIASIRNRGNQRQYPREVLRRLAIIRVAVDLGFSLAEILELLNPLPPNKEPTAEAIQGLIAVWREAIDQRIHGLTVLRDNLDGCIGCGCLTKEDCPLRNPDDQLANKGTGAVIIQDMTTERVNGSDASQA